MANQNLDNNENEINKENESVSVPETKKRNPPTLLLSLVFALLLIGVGGFAAFAYFNKTWPFASKVVITKIDTVPSTSPTPLAQNVDWNLMLTKIPICDAKTQWTQAKITFDNDTLKNLGINDLVEQGYAVAQLCRDNSTDRIVFILAKQELTRPAPNIDPTCVNSCDKVVFGNINTITKEVNNKISNNHLGIYTESYNQFCFIDKVMPSGNSQLNDLLFLYCGSGESGGLTKWYSYDFSNDNLTLVQQMNNLEPESFDVKDSRLLGSFKYKSNADIKIPVTTSTPATFPTAKPSVSQPNPATESKRQQAGSISIMVPSGYVFRENSLLLNAYKSEGLADNMIGVWMIVPDNYDSMQRDIAEGKITAEQAANEFMKTSLSIDIREEKPAGQDLNSWIEAKYGQLGKGKNDELVSGTMEINGKTVQVRSVKNTIIGTFTVMYFIQPKLGGDIITLISFELANRPLKNQVDNLIKSIQF